MDNYNSHPHGIQVTAKALAELHAALRRDGISPQHGGMRLKVEGGGCAGLTCRALVESAPGERDRILQVDGARLFLDPRSFIFLFESTLDYQETPPAGFTVKSKHGTNGFCGCPSGKPNS
ncbi:MAG TPA: iron-sulfur cluster biosynthesis family protein [Terriglobales bacterium]|nr:iron-sulfur cluster biosynthesis family protein [Terriglobales bacterium]